MRKIISLFFMIVLVTATFVSCTSTKSGSTCPSHDPNYFRKGK